MAYPPGWRKMREMKATLPEPHIGSIADVESGDSELVGEANQGENPWGIDECPYCSALPQLLTVEMWRRHLPVGALDGHDAMEWVYLCWNKVNGSVAGCPVVGPAKTIDDVNKLWAQECRRKRRALWNATSNIKAT